MLAHGSFPRSLLLPEGGRVGTFLVCSCNGIVVDLHACTHASGSRRIQSLLPYRYLVTQTLDQSTWQRREQRRPQLRPQPQRKRLLSRQAWICSSQILLACFFKYLHLLITTFSYTTLWMQPSGLSHLRLFPTETGVRYFVKSFVLCAEGHRHPQQGWVAARADYWPLKANKAYVRKKWFIIFWIAREIMKPSSKCEPEFFPS